MQIQSKFVLQRYTSKVPGLRNDCVSWNSSQDTPKITGVPPHVLLMSKVEELLQKFSALRVDIKGDIGGMLDIRGVGGSEFHTNQILDAIKNSAASAICVTEVSRLTDEESSDEDVIAITDEESAIISVDVDDSDHHPELLGIVERRRRSTAKKIMSKRKLTMGYHHGKLQVLPPLWKFPKMNAKQLIANWYVGNVREKIPPYALLSHNNVAHLGSAQTPNLGKTKLRQMRLVMTLIERYARIERCYEEDKNKWTTEYARVIWEKIGAKYIGAKFGGTNRNAELSWKTLYNKMMKAKAFSSCNLPSVLTPVSIHNIDIAIV